ncbi:anthranilate synthase component II [Paraglaciecola hydrolytica]|uniref:Anthranilate synthase n=1 Tax=Paraglaciecola hydrolytica TaxID=1799789 RepID=A0A136A1S1_9ALTE|nr:aminodeoxychorismate/anthranilate synthase component II [Paraglaciecola hydrolytica]KXI29198.1 anthranilate synthase [Paraglaciecola hydrolytica]
MLLLIDNYDSFTHNLARYFVELGQQVKVVRNDQLDCHDIAKLNPDYLVISPGPCTPDQAGISLAAIEQFAGKIPLLGVCLGHQAIGQVFGAKVVRALNIKHGKTSLIEHSNSRLFSDVPSPFTATRYHSLLLEPSSISADFTISAWCNEGEANHEIMAIEHKFLALAGVQFHPESLLTEFGHQILANFINHFAPKPAGEG